MGGTPPALRFLDSPSFDSGTDEPEFIVEGQREGGEMLEAQLNHSWKPKQLVMRITMIYSGLWFLLEVSSLWLLVFSTIPTGMISTYGYNMVSFLSLASISDGKDRRQL